jgi:hypothetical protein
MQRTAAAAQLQLLLLVLPVARGHKEELRFWHSTELVIVKHTNALPDYSCVLLHRMCFVCTM